MFHGSRGLIVHMIVLVIIWGIITTCLGCSTNPATGKKQLNILDTSKEISVGNQAAPGFIEGYGGIIPSKQIQSYVSNLGLRLAAVSERSDLPWEFSVLDSVLINAFALPGGKVFITRGLLAKLENEAQLAGVLGHEIGHVTAQHVGQQMTGAILLQTAVIGVGLANQHHDNEWLKILGIGAQAGGTVYLLKFGRNQEMESDTLAIRYMTRLKYSPVGQLQVMNVLQADTKNSSKLSEILSTHPLPTTRIHHLEKHIESQYPDSANPNIYRFNFDQYQAAVLEPLKKLPPAKHKTQEPN